MGFLASNLILENQKSNNKIDFYFLISIKFYDLKGFEILLAMQHFVETKNL